MLVVEHPVERVTGSIVMDPGTDALPVIDHPSEMLGAVKRGTSVVDDQISI